MLLLLCGGKYVHLLPRDHSKGMTTVEYFVQFPLPSNTSSSDRAMISSEVYTTRFYALMDISPCQATLDRDGVTVHAGKLLTINGFSFVAERTRHIVVNNLLCYASSTLFGTKLRFVRRQILYGDITFFEADITFYHMAVTKQIWYIHCTYLFIHNKIYLLQEYI